MPARRCSNCGITYPSDCGTCKVCNEQTSWFMNASPDADWREQVEALSAPALEPVDPVENWRFEELLDAGYSPGSASELAARRDVDLHRAVKLARAAGAELAYRIVS